MRSGLGALISRWVVMMVKVLLCVWFVKFCLSFNSIDVLFF